MLSLTALWRYISEFDKHPLCHRRMQKCHKYTEMGSILNWEYQLKVVFPAWSSKITCLSRRCEERNCLLFWLVLYSKKLCKIPFLQKALLHHRNNGLHFLSGQKLFWQINGPKGRLFFIRVNELREKTLIVCGLVQERYWKVLDFHTFTESKDNHGST